MIRIFRLYEQHSLERVNSFFEKEKVIFNQNPEKFKQFHGYNYTYRTIDNIQCLIPNRKYCLMHGSDDRWYFGVDSALNYFGFMDGDGNYYTFDCSTPEKTTQVMEKIQHWIDIGKIVEDDCLYLAPDDEFEDI